MASFSVSLTIILAFQQLTVIEIIPPYSEGYSTLESYYILYTKAKSDPGLFLSWSEQQHGPVLVIAYFCLNSHLK